MQAADSSPNGRSGESGDSPNGQVAGRYRLYRRLAVGGMGEVYLAAQTGPMGFEKVVALKRMLPTMARERELMALFLDEARLVAKLTHRGIAQIIELGKDASGYFVALEFVPGPSVASLLDKLRATNERIPPWLALDIAAQVADALAYAHSATDIDGSPLRIIHRDVSPQNILVSLAGDVKLIDFGIAKNAKQQHATVGGGIKGKLAYMSPEQIRGLPLDGRSDLFSLGLVLFEMLTGKNPFSKDDAVQTLLAIQNEAVPVLVFKDPRLGPCDALFRKLLAKNPQERFKDGHELHDALRVIQGRMARPPNRLNIYVTERFGKEFAALTSGFKTQQPLLLTHLAPGGESSDAATSPDELARPFELEPGLASEGHGITEPSAQMPAAAKAPSKSPPAASPSGRADGGSRHRAGGGSTGSGSILESAISPGDGKNTFRSAALGILMVLGVAVGAGYYFDATRTNSAIDKITQARTPAQKEQLLTEARSLVASEPDKGQKAFYQGRLEEAQDRAAASLGYYRFGAATGNKPSKERIIEMLRHPDCAARVEAIHAAGDFRLIEAKGQLERLAAQGGRDDTQSPVAGGCDSQSVARAVLWMLNRP